MLSDTLTEHEKAYNGKSNKTADGCKNAAISVFAMGGLPQRVDIVMGAG